MQATASFPVYADNKQSCRNWNRYTQTQIIVILFKRQILMMGCSAWLSQVCYLHKSQINLGVELSGLIRDLRQSSITCSCICCFGGFFPLMCCHFNYVGFV